MVTKAQKTSAQGLENGVQQTEVTKLEREEKRRKYTLAKKKTEGEKKERTLVWGTALKKMLTNTANLEVNCRGKKGENQRTNKRGGA